MDARIEPVRGRRPGSSQLFTFSLTVESDARAIARRMHDDAAQNAVAVSAETPLMKRFAGAFATEWLRPAATRPARSASIQHPRR